MLKPAEKYYSFTDSSFKEVYNFFKSYTGLINVAFLSHVLHGYFTAQKGFPIILKQPLPSTKEFD
jgi:hypothetical protein